MGNGAMQTIHTYMYTYTLSHSLVILNTLSPSHTLPHTHCGTHTHTHCGTHPHTLWHTLTHTHTVAHTPHTLWHTHTPSHTVAHTHPHTHWHTPSHTHLLHVDVKGAVRLTLWTGRRLHLLLLALVERTQHEATLDTVILDHVQLREDSSAAGHHTSGTDQLVQVELPVYTREHVHTQ